MQKRVICVFFAFALALGILVTQLAIINLGGSKAVNHTSNTISTVMSQTRGTVYDCNMQPLVNTQTKLLLAVKPEATALYDIGSIVTDDTRAYLYNEITQGRIGVAEVLNGIESNNAVTAQAVSRYCDDGIAVHVVGYIDSDGNGVCGIEKYYNDFLKSKKGYLKAKCSVDALGHILEGVPIYTASQNYNSKAGVVLTIDADIQKICEAALNEFGIEKGAVVVLDIETSEIRALASVPEFCQNNPAASLEDEASPFVNRAITPYSVGSVFKAVVAAAAIENGIGTNTTNTCNGSYKIGPNEFGCHNESGHGTINMYTAMAQSCNPYFINLAIKTGKESIINMSVNLGLGSKTELADGQYTNAGVMPSAQDIVSNQDLANLAFGQGSLLASPLQMAAVYAAIANDGVYRSPSLMKAITDENGFETMRAELPASRRAMSVETAATVQSLLLETVEKGSGGKAKPESTSAAGKTATAQSGQFNLDGTEITQSWFCGYFPYDVPEYAVTVLKENGEGGSADCAPVFKFIADEICKIRK